MSADELVQAQEALSKTLEKAHASEDRQLASVVRERGEQVARLLAGVLRLPRLYDLTNDAFRQPGEALLQEMIALRELLGSIHFVLVESNIYVNDIRVRFDPNSETPRHLTEQLGAHRIGGLSFHQLPTWSQLLKLVGRLDQPPAAQAPRKTIVAWLEAEGMPFIEVHPPYRFRLKGEGAQVVRTDVRHAYSRSASVASELFGNLARGRSPNTVAVRRIVTDLVDRREGERFVEMVAAQRDARTPAAVRHAVQVANLAILIGRELGLPDAALSDLGVAAFVHDGGYAEDEGGFPPPFERHGTAGARLILRQRGFHEARIRRLLVCLQHHRPYNHPRRPSLFARIVRVADDYDTLTRFRSTGPLVAPPDAMAGLNAAAGSLYDPLVVQALINRLGCYPPGSVLELDDGRWMAVASGVRGPELFDKPLGVLVRGADGRPPKGRVQVDLAQGGRVHRVIRPRG